MKGLANTTGFFASLRTGLLQPKIEQDQVDGCVAVLDACAAWPVAWAAYGLATTYHETSHTMLPVRERGNARYFEKYDSGKIAAALGNTSEVDGDGEWYCGRGYVQLTGHANYERAEKELGKPFTSIPDLALVPENAAAVLVRGMTEGWFTGKRMSDLLPPAGPATHQQFIAGRRIINGTDKAEMIAHYAMHFQTALLVGNWT